MTAVSANGITIEYESFGPVDSPPMLLIMGLGAQLTLWPTEFCDLLVERGFRVIRFDNRDAGLSSRLDAAHSYTLRDMAADTVGLLDALRIERAHIVGLSMGGMIAQILAAGYPERVLSLTSIMSTSGNPALPQARPEAAAMLTSRPASTEAAAIIDFSVHASRVIGSPAYPAAEQRLRDRARADYERAYSPDGFARQLVAAFSAGDRRAELATIIAPTLVIHGQADPLITVEGGRDTAKHIRGARLLVIPGMGHDLPIELLRTIAEAIVELISG